MDKRIEQMYDIMQYLNDEHKEVSTFIDIELNKSCNSIINEFMNWSKDSSKIPKNERGKFFNDSLPILKKLVERNYFLTKQFGNSEAKAIYWKLKYRAVESEEKNIEKLYEQIQRLLDENDKLKGH